VPKTSRREVFAVVPKTSGEGVSRFFVNTQDGRVATLSQLDDAGLIDDEGKAATPWYRIRGSSDASTMWYAAMVKKERGVFIGTLCIRHLNRKASLEKQGWTEVPVESIGV